MEKRLVRRLFVNSERCAAAEIEGPDLQTITIISRRGRGREVGLPQAPPLCDLARLLCWSQGQEKVKPKIRHKPPPYLETNK